jgi:prepilin-type N-terminal cleavage/methylation domain-containing protein
MSAARRRRPVARRGSTLLEVLVAVVVFAIGLLSLMAGSLVGARAMRDSKSFASAAMAAQSTVDSLKAVGWADIAGASGSYSVRGHDVTWSVSNDDPRRVVVTITRRTLPSGVYDSLVAFIGKPDIAR